MPCADSWLVNSVLISFMIKVDCISFTHPILRSAGRASTIQAESPHVPSFPRGEGHLPSEPIGLLVHVPGVFSKALSPLVILGLTIYRQCTFTPLWLSRWNQILNRTIDKLSSFEVGTHQDRPNQNKARQDQAHIMSSDALSRLLAGGAALVWHSLVHLHHKWSLFGGAHTTTHPNLVFLSWEVTTTTTTSTTTT